MFLDKASSVIIEAFLVFKVVSLQSKIKICVLSHLKKTKLM